MRGTERRRCSEIPTFKRELPDVHYGEIDENRDYAKEVREHPVLDDEDDDDDEKPTDPSVIRMLGFDPQNWDGWDM